MTERERWWLVATVWMEARGEPAEGQRAVAHVILNRLNAKRWGHTVGAVVLAPLQFSAWNSDSPTRHALAYVDETSDPTWLVVGDSCAYAFTQPDPTNGALNYYNPAVCSPPWAADPALPHIQIGRHVFVAGVP